MVACRTRYVKTLHVAVATTLVPAMISSVRILMSRAVGKACHNDTALLLSANRRNLNEKKICERERESTRRWTSLHADMMVPLQNARLAETHHLQQQRGFVLQHECKVNIVYRTHSPPLPVGHEVPCKNFSFKRGIDR